MKRNLIFIAATMFLASCAMPEIPIPGFLVTPSRAPTLPPTSAPITTATDTPTITPTLPTPTFTFTPTMIGAKSQTPTGEAGETSEPPVEPTNTMGLVVQPQAISGFTRISLSSSEFYIGGCEPTEVRFTAQVASPAEAAFVVLFVRFKSVNSDATSEWTSITMENRGAGTFMHALKADEMKAVEFFKEPWVQYQLVVTNSKLKEMGRTQIFDGALRLKNCVATPTATP